MKKIFTLLVGCVFITILGIGIAFLVIIGKTANTLSMKKEE